MLAKTTEYLERIVLVIIILMTLGAIGFEIHDIYVRQDINLADLLLFFIYTEVLAMVGMFLKSRELPVIYPILIAITALSRLIILQGKEMNPANILYEAIAILVLAIAIVLMRTNVFTSIFRRIEGKGEE